MEALLYQISLQPWFLPGAVGVASLLLGLLIPRRGGANWLAGVVFFLPNLFLDFLDMVHTKKFKYYGLILALLSIEAFFAFRASTVYYDVLNKRMPGPEMAIVCVIVFVAIFLCGYMVATHGGKWNFWRVCTMIFVIIHDWAGTVWMNYSQAATVTPDNDPLKVVLTIGMCVLGLLPFIMGAWAEELRPELQAEQEEETNEFTSLATRKIKRRAVEKVLRLANHTDVVQLVRALPASEFADFKTFVMPIIAPGVSHNLDSIYTTQSQNSPAQLAPISASNPPKKSGFFSPKPGEKEQDKNTPAGQQSAQVAPDNFGQPALSGYGNIINLPAKTAEVATGQIADNSEDKLDLTVAFLRANPQATDEDLATHLHLSRPASALFWRRKAEFLIDAQQAGSNEVLGESEPDEPITNPPVMPVHTIDENRLEPAQEPQENAERTALEPVSAYAAGRSYNSAPAAYSGPSAYLAPADEEQEKPEPTTSGRLAAIKGMTLEELLEYPPLIDTFKRKDTRKNEILAAIRSGALRQKRDNSVTRNAVATWLADRKKAESQN